MNNDTTHLDPLTNAELEQALQSQNILTWSRLRENITHVIENEMKGCKDEMGEIGRHVTHMKYIKALREGTQCQHTPIRRKELAGDRIIEFFDNHISVTIRACYGYKNVIGRKLDMVQINGEYYTQEYLDNNATVCDRCEAYAFETNDVQGQTWCEHCYENYANTCEHCGEAYCDERYCGCEDAESSPHVKSYSHNVLDDLDFLELDDEDKAKSKGLYFGVELETNVRKDEEFEDVAESTAENLEGFAILKEDSSIGPRGFEIVTAPATLNYHRNGGWTRFFKDSAKHLKAWDTGTCGIHIHFSRAAVSQMTLGKMLVFYHSPENSDFLSQIAGREVSPTAQWCKQKAEKLKLSKTPHEGDHYEALNISTHNNGKTGEVRIFRGNVTYHGVIRALEFVAATIKFCETAGVRELTAQKFIGFMTDHANRKAYPDLTKQMVNLAILSSTSKPNTKIIKKAA